MEHTHMDIENLFAIKKRKIIKPKEVSRIYIVPDKVS